MTSDESMDARLREAGARWRESTDTAMPVVNAPAVVDIATEPVVHDLTEARRRHRRWAWVATAAAVVVLGGGATALIARHDSGNARDNVAGTAPELTDTNWTLQSITGADGKAVPVAGNASLHFSDGKVSGRDGCNSISGDFTIVGSQLLRLPNGLAITDMACLDPDVSATAAAVDGFLSPPSTPASTVGGDIDYVVDGDLLTLTNSGGGTLVYRGEATAKASTDPKDIVGTWALSSITHETTSSDGSSDGGGSASGGSNYDAIQVSFDGAGHVGIKHTCYTNVGAVDIGAGTLDITGVTLESALPCPEQAANAMQEENGAVDDVMSGHVTWQVLDGQLTVKKQKTSTTSTSLDFKQTSSEPANGSSSTGTNGPDEIVGTWYLRSVTTSGGKSSNTTAPTPPYKVTFSGDGTASVSAGHTTVVGSYRVDGQSLTTGLTLTATAGCDIEAHLAEALKSGPTWRVENGVLTLALGDSLSLDFGQTDTAGDVSSNIC